MKTFINYLNENENNSETFEKLTKYDEDLFTRTIKTMSGKKIEHSFNSYEPDENDEFFFWADRVFLFESHMIKELGDHDMHDKIGVVHRIFENGEEIGLQMVLKLKNGQYRFYNDYPNKTEKDFDNLANAIKNFSN